MEKTTRNADPPVIQQLLENGPRYSFYRAVQLLELCHSDRPGIGMNGPAREEAVRLRPNLSFVVPRTTVSCIEEAQETAEHARRFVVVENFIGLYGIASPMPEIYSEEILRRDLDPDPVLDFLDLFHHRLLSLLYRSWARYRPHVTFRSGGTDGILETILSISGFGHATLLDAAPLEPTGLARYAELFSRRAKTAEGLEVILSDAFGGTSVKALPYGIRTVVIPDDQVCRLGQSSSTLGEDFILGEVVHDAAGKFTLKIGPFDRPGFLALAPGGESRALAGALVHLYLIDPLEHDVVLGIVGEAKPAFQLSGGLEGQRLGVDTWINSERPATSWESFPGFPAASREALKDKAA